MNILIDMDGVICTEEKTFERSLAKPIPGAKEALESLRAEGHQIIIYTARTWSELAMTKFWLEKYEIPFDGIHMGKPVADRIVDDRAIAFNGWPAALEVLSKDGKPDVDLIYLRILRLATADFIREAADYSGLQGPVLEVGPMSKDGNNSPVYRYLPESFVDTRSLIESRDLKYISLDIDGASKPDIVADFLDVEKHIVPASIGTVFMMSCLEHMPKVFEVPDLLEKILAPGGRAFLLTPWNLRFHGPRPDCWRISDDGYVALFSKSFTIERLTKIPCPGRPLSPVGVQCILRKP
jgi:hypothetical protein